MSFTSVESTPAVPAVNDAASDAAQTLQLQGLQHFYMPFDLERADDEAREIEGFCYTSGRVPGDKWNLTRAALEGATAAYMEMPALRSMHQSIAAGKGMAVRWDEQGRCILRAKVVDDNEWRKVKEGVYRGFSIGGRPIIARGSDIEKFDWVETSLVDRPKDPGALFTVARAEAADDINEEYVVQVLPERRETPRDDDTVGDEAVARAHSSKRNEWITMNGTHVHLDENGNHKFDKPQGKKSGDVKEHHVRDAVDRAGIKDPKARAAFLDAHDKGHIKSHEQLDAIANHVKEHGDDEGTTVSAINRHGGGDGKYQAPQTDDTADKSTPDKDVPAKSPEEHAETIADKARKDSVDVKERDGGKAKTVTPEEHEGKTRYRVHDKGTPAHTGKIMDSDALHEWAKTVQMVSSDAAEVGKAATQAGEHVGTATANAAAQTATQRGAGFDESSEDEPSEAEPVERFDDSQPRADDGKWTSGGGSGKASGNKASGVHLSTDEKGQLAKKLEVAAHRHASDWDMPKSSAHAALAQKVASHDESQPLSLSPAERDMATEVTRPPAKGMYDDYAPHLAAKPDTNLHNKLADLSHLSAPDYRAHVEHAAAQSARWETNERSNVIKKAMVQEHEGGTRHDSLSALKKAAGNHYRAAISDDSAMQRVLTSADVPVRENLEDDKDDDLNGVTDEAADKKEPVEDAVDLSQSEVDDDTKEKLQRFLDGKMTFTDLLPQVADRQLAAAFDALTQCLTMGLYPSLGDGDRTTACQRAINEFSAWAKQWVQDNVTAAFSAADKTSPHLGRADEVMAELNDLRRGIANTNAGDGLALQRFEELRPSFEYEKAQLIQRVDGLESDVTRLNGDLSTAQTDLELTRSQLSDAKGTVERLRGTSLTRTLPMQYSTVPLDRTFAVDSLLEKAEAALSPVDVRRRLEEEKSALLERAQSTPDAKVREGISTQIMQIDMVLNRLG